MNEPCPVCKARNEAGPFVEHVTTDKDGNQVKQYGPENVVCQCGAILEFITPIFKMSESGNTCRVIGYRVNKEAK